MTTPQSPGILDVNCFVITRSVIQFCEDFLRETGRKGFEGLVLWGGRRRGALPIIDVDFALAPKQRCFRTAQGVGLSVDEDELFRINVEFYNKGLRLVGQVHSHPSDAYHSDVDDDFATVTMPGGVSLVLPDFAVRAFSLDDLAAHRLNAVGRWEALDATATRHLLRIAPAADVENI